MLYDKLENYKKTDYYPFHMPGHKRNAKIKMDNPYEMDITEIDGFDNLHCPTEIIKEEMERARCLYSSDKTYFLVNGSTCGILSAISSVTEYGDTVIVARNCHKAVYHALELRGLTAAYLYPPQIPQFQILGGIALEELEQCIVENSHAKAVIITSPTYEGIVSDIRSLAEIVHQAGMILIVDEAHGAHFSRYPSFPKSALDQGADIVIQSLHKTLPALTQTALLHIKGKRASHRKMEKYLQIYQTSSPSYVLMASISQCMTWLEGQSFQDFSAYVELLKQMQENIRKISHLHFLNPSFIGQYNIFDIDMSKLVIRGNEPNGFTGKQLYDELLSKFHLQMEMAASNYALAMTSVMDTPCGIKRLWEALEQIDNAIANCPQDHREKGIAKKIVQAGDGAADKELEVRKENESKAESKTVKREQAIVCISISQAGEREQEKLLFTHSAGKISGEYIYVYPPGIPVITPGEMLTKEIINRCLQYIKDGLTVMGTEDKTLMFIKVVSE